MKKVTELEQRHMELSLRRQREEHAGLLDDARSFVAEISQAGTEIADIRSRSYLGMILGLWVEYIFDRTGKWPKVDLNAPSLDVQDKDVDWVKEESEGEVESALRLEVPTGAIPLDSPFYVERVADFQLKRQLENSGTITTIRGARQTGKTSLLVRGVDYAKKRGALVLYLDFQLVSSYQLAGVNQFFKSFTYEVADQAQIGLSSADALWQNPLSPQTKTTRFVEEILRGANRSVVLAMDEADVLLRTSFYSEFFGLLRAWHNRRVLDELWKNLNIVIAISTHPFLLITDINQSPFNVGLTLRLDDFSEVQVADLNERHGSPLRSEEISQVMELLGGHPYLIRQVLYTLVEEAMTWPDLMAIADGEEGPFGGHLRYYLNLLHDDKELMEAMRRVVNEGACPEDKAFLRLSSAGLMQQRGDKCVCRYGLYEKFFRSQLL